MSDEILLQDPDDMTPEQTERLARVTEQSGQMIETLPEMFKPDEALEAIMLTFRRVARAGVKHGGMDLEAITFVLGILAAQVIRDNADEDAPRLFVPDHVTGGGRIIH